MRRLFAALTVGLMLSACGSEPVRRGTDVLVLGDSVMAWNGWRGQGIADALERRTGLTVTDRAVSGADMLGAGRDSIPGQYVEGDFDWVVFDGGANDLLGQCGCNGCDDVLERLISPDGSDGAIADLARRARADGARVIYLGAYRAPTGRFLFQGCDDELDEIDRRVARLAARSPGITFVSGKRALDPEEPRHFFIDRLHPSPRGSARLAALIAATMRAATDG